MTLKGVQTMKKHKYMEEIDEIGTRETGSEETPTKQKSTRRILKSFLILVLTALCVVGLILIKKVNQKTHADTLTAPQTINNIISKKIPLLKKEPVKNTTETPFVETIPDTPVIPTISAPINTVSTIDNSISDTNLSVPISNKTPTETVPEAEPIVIDTKTNYTLAQALTFKENFLNGHSCRNDYLALTDSTNKTPDMLKAINNLSPYCLNHQNAAENVRKAFLKNKRNALVAMYQMKSPLWLSYLKTIPVYLVEIRKLNPTGSKPKDLIYKAQNELYQNNIEQADKILKQLPENMQLAMLDFFREAELYLRADKSLTSLILSFEK